jgi:NTP pyrophosphatase (non-canonical NTP hydrolase)
MTNEIELDPELSRLNDLRDICFRVAESKGWYEKCQKDDPNTFAMLLALIHREVSEALGDHRNGCDITEQTWCPHEDKPIGIPTELADVIMLVLSVCGYYGVDIRRAISEKLQYNKERAYRHGGKVV